VRQRRCFLDNGVVGGSITALGAASVPVADAWTPTVAAVPCMVPSASSSLNAFTGLPGPGRALLRGSVVNHP
jgi:hypothetical protein